MKAIDDLHRRGAQDVVISRAGGPAIALIDKRRHRVVAPSFDVVAAARRTTSILMQRLPRTDSLRSEDERIGVPRLSSGGKTKSGRWARQVSFWSRRKTAAGRPRHGRLALST
jgi:hypothetical protein